MDEYIGKPSTDDQKKIKKAYAEFLLGKSFDELGLDEFQKECLKKYMEVASGDKFGTQIASELRWPVTFCCSLQSQDS